MLAASSIIKRALIGGTILALLLLQHSLATAAEPVNIISNTSSTDVNTSLKTALNLAQSIKTGTDIEALKLKEYVLDPIARNQAQKLTQQLSGNMLKMLGGQLPGQNGEVPFIRNYEEFDANVIDQALGEAIFSENLSDACSERRTFATRAAVYNFVNKEIRNQKEPTQCQVDDGLPALESILLSYDSCKDGICGAMQGQKRASLAAVNAVNVANREVTNGFLPKKVCKGSSATPMGTGSNPAGPTGNSSSWGGSSLECDIVTPSSIINDAISFGVAELPALQLLNVDELNEVVSNFLSNLTNQAINSATGLLGLSGNSDYGGNTFGPGGNLSYADALAQDDISQYQSNTQNPIKEAIANEQKYKQLQTKILTDILALEAKLDENAEEFPQCFELELTDELEQAKTDAITNLEISSTTMAILTLLDSQYDAAKDASVKNAVITTFVEYKNDGYFRTAVQNQELELTYINYTFAEMVDKFKYDTAVERFDCGGDFDYEGVLDPPNRVND